LIINNFLLLRLLIFFLIFFSTVLISFNANAQQSGKSHTLTFKNNCSTESIWIAAYNGFSGDEPLLCEISHTGTIKTGTCSRNLAGGVPPPWKSDGGATWEIPSNESRSLTVPFCYTSAVFGARTGCTQNSSGGLNCKGGDCGGLLNCGTNGKQSQPITLAEFTFDGGEANCNDLDNYDVSAAAAFNMRVKITPSKSGCVVAGNQCKTLDGVCPYNKVLWNSTTNQWEIATGSDTDITTCLAPTNMAAFPGISPFTNFTDDEKARVGCNPAPYNISPIQPAGNCFATFDSGGTCTLSACGLGATFCDPYGQCDAELTRTAIWPSYTDPNTMMSTPSTIYIENIQKACGNNTNGGGIYAWQFDDNNTPPGLSGGLYTCPSAAPQVQGINYTINFWCDGNKDGDGLKNEVDNDSDNDGIPNSIESMSGKSQPDARVGDDPNDFDGDRLINELDLDSDCDGIPDHTEAGLLNDINNDGIADNFTDNDNDGLNDAHDEDQGGEQINLPDTDGDGLPDYLDSDSDGDGVSDANETTGMDLDDDGCHDGVDVNSDGLVDNVHPETGFPLTFIDSDNDGIFDHLDAEDALQEACINCGNGCSLAENKDTGFKFSLFLLIPAFIIIRRLKRKN